MLLVDLALPLSALEHCVLVDAETCLHRGEREREELRFVVSYRFRTKSAFRVYGYKFWRTMGMNKCFKGFLRNGGGSA